MTSRQLQNLKRKYLREGYKMAMKERYYLADELGPNQTTAKLEEFYNKIDKMLRRDPAFREMLFELIDSKIPEDLSKFAEYGDATPDVMEESFNNIRLRFAAQSSGDIADSVKRIIKRNYDIAVNEIEETLSDPPKARYS